MIHWAWIHRKNYDGTCEYCGGVCGDERSILERRRVCDMIDRLTYVSEHLPLTRDQRNRLRYLSNRYARTFSYHFE